MIEPQRMTIVEFDRFVETADEMFTYELHDGTVLAFASGTVAHVRLARRLAALIEPMVTTPCEVFGGSLCVRRHPDRASSVVPDVFVTCEQPPSEQLFVTAPMLVIEVMSASSVTNDLVRKLRIYEAVDTIAEYLVVDARSVWARLFRRDDNGKLTRSVTTSASRKHDRA